jgi:Putative Ig domain
MLRIKIFFILGAYLLCVLTAQFAFPQNSTQPNEAQPAPQNAPSEPPLQIENDSQLPETYPRAVYEYEFHAHAGVPPLHWHVDKGALPPGLRLDDNGFLHGQPERTGEFEFTVSVRDSATTPETVQKSFLLRVHSALIVNWKTPAHVSANRIEGSVNVSNTTPDDMDLTFVVMAVAGNGRATAIGYQHFSLASGMLNKDLPFGETLPHGGYVVHVDVVGEVPPKNLIYRERMQSPGPLQVTIGP